ncbi:hypothetical protein ACRAWB_05315 [Leifsonia poae]|uniref:hypothetical protein n=1 Tax=Leifsonia poae TaxID=110933 RepID=UPI003D681978
MNDHHEYLVVYDYGMGGLWGFVSAPSAEAVRERYPELAVVDDPPEWMDADTLAELRATRTPGIDDPTTGILAVVVRDRRSP